DFYFENEPSIRLFLHGLDLVKFRDVCTQVNPGSLFLKTVIERIEKIGAYGIKSGKRIFVGYDKDVKVSNKKGKSQHRQSYFYTKHVSFSRETNTLPEKYTDQIISGDSEKVLKDIPDNSIDFMLTSPPYNFGMEYSEHNDTFYWENYFNKIERILTECIRVLKWGGRIALNVQPLYSDYIPTHHIFSNMLMSKGMIWKGEILWEKNNYNAKYTAWGSWVSPSSPYLKYTWEFIEVFCKGDLKKEGDKANADLTPDEFKKWTIGKWIIAPERNMKKFNHPAMFPEELAIRAIKLFTYKGDIVLDPFNGVGTTTYVSKTLGRHFVGIDVSDEYCKSAEKRLSLVNTSQ
ncbi:site-specific DNA-methyltransferase, partial [bacterium]|nr:site-specific DNA-methyltransferase [bacterium]